MAAGDTDPARGMRLAARENLAAALLLLDRGYLRAAASRFYFSMFQAGVCALERRGAEPPSSRDRYWSHETVWRLVRTLRDDPADALRFRDMRTMRLSGYYRVWKFHRRDLERMKHDVRRFVEEVTE
ncbi:MAG: hypothetical protein ACREIU_16220 [Planctomycetota bacterium]